MLDTIKAAVGEQNLQGAFWTMIGTLIISNFGLVASAVASHFKKMRKMRTDINSAFTRIRILESENKKEK